VVVLTPDAGSRLDVAARLEWRASGRRSDRLLSLCVNRYHLHRFTGAGLEALFARCGFDRERLERVALFSLRGDRYLAGFAPGLAGVTGRAALDRALSRAAYWALRAARIRNKLLYVGVRSAASAPSAVAC
jgi:hypothetical protein